MEEILGSFFLAIIISLFYLLFFNNVIAPFRRKKVLKKVEDKGHVVKATLFSERFGATDTRLSNSVDCIYKYCVNGNNYKYRAWTSSNPPKEIYLYYVRWPSRAKSQYALGQIEMPELVFIIAFLLVWIVIW